jgi:hypothetical protein
LVTVTGHRADGVRDSLLDNIAAGFRGLETRAALEGVHGFVLNQVGTNEALTELRSTIVLFFIVDLLSIFLFWVDER